MSEIYSRKGGLQYAKGNDDSLYLFGEEEHHVLGGLAPTVLIPEIDGERTDEDIVDIVSSSLSPAEAYYGLLELHSKGFILKREALQRVPDAAWWHHAGVCTDRLHNKINCFSLSVLCEDKKRGRRISEALLRVGFGLEPRPEKLPLDILVCNDYCSPGVRESVQSASKNGRLCCPVKLIGRTIWFGPVFRPQQKPCFTCFHTQLVRNRPVETYLNKKGVSAKTLSSSSPVSKLSLHLAISLIPLYLVRHLMEEEVGSAATSLETFDLWTMKAERHRVRILPHCSQCGDKTLFSSLAGRRIVLSESSMKFAGDGGYRSCKPEETWENHKQLVSRITGIIADIGPLERKSHPLRPVFGASYFVHPPTDEVTAEERFIKHSYGKGHTAAQARASALCEAIERYNAMYQGDEPVIRGTYQQLRSRAVDPRELLNFSRTQYEEREKWERLCPRQPVPLRFDPSVAINWTPAWSLTHNRERLLPLSYCYSYVPTPPIERMCPHNPNGHAAGNTLEEAILQAFLELVERDAVAIWWYNRLLLPSVNLTSFNDPYFIYVQQHYLDLGWELWVLDLTHDFNIPVCAAIARNSVNGGFIIGMGAHLNIDLAVQRAITELHQVFDPGASQGFIWSQEEIEKPEFLMPSCSTTPRNHDDYPSPAQRSIRMDIRYCLDKAWSMGLETIVLDYSRPDVTLKTTKVVVPGLRHFWPRLGPGRLYQVPVKMGWLRQPLAEDDLNPLPLIL